MTNHKLYAVAWDDAHFNSGEFEAHEVVHRAWKYTTVGILVREDAEGITLATDLGEDGRYRGTNFIPKGMIRESYQVGTLRPPKRLRKKRQDSAVPEVQTKAVSPNAQ